MPTEQEKAAAAYKAAAKQRDPAAVRDANATAQAAGSNGARPS
ncbi:hypothetical protein [Streptomyces sp. IB2014 016-6]|nr:hypothetical protein [Streptomyces sp. IB2014 016-6]